MRAAVRSEPVCRLVGLLCHYLYWTMLRARSDGATLDEEDRQQVFMARPTHTTLPRFSPPPHRGNGRVQYPGIRAHKSSHRLTVMLGLVLVFLFSSQAIAATFTELQLQLGGTGRDGRRAARRTLPRNT